MVTTRQVNHRKEHAPAAVLRFLIGFVQIRSGFEVSGDVQSRLQSNAGADAQSRHLDDELVPDATSATSSDVTPRGAGVCFR